MTLETVRRADCTDSLTRLLARERETGAKADVIQVCEFGFEFFEYSEDSGMGSLCLKGEDVEKVPEEDCGEGGYVDD